MLKIRLRKVKDKKADVAEKSVDTMLEDKDFSASFEAGSESFLSQDYQSDFSGLFEQPAGESESQSAARRLAELRQERAQQKQQLDQAFVEQKKPSAQEEPAPSAEKASVEEEPTEKALTEEASIEKASIDAVPTEAASIEAASTEAVPTEAVPTEAVPTEAVPTEAVPTEAVPTEAVSTEAASGKAFLEDNLEGFSFADPSAKPKASLESLMSSELDVFASDKRKAQEEKGSSPKSDVDLFADDGFPFDRQTKQEPSWTQEKEAFALSAHSMKEEPQPLAAEEVFSGASMGFTEKISAIDDMYAAFASDDERKPKGRRAARAARGRAGRNSFDGDFLSFSFEDSDDVSALQDEAGEPFLLADRLNFSFGSNYEKSMPAEALDESFWDARTTDFIQDGSRAAGGRSSARRQGSSRKTRADKERADAASSRFAAAEDVEQDASRGTAQKRSSGKSRLQPLFDKQGRLAAREPESPLVKVNEVANEVLFEASLQQGKDDLAAFFGLMPASEFSRLATEEAGAGSDEALSLADGRIEGASPSAIEGLDFAFAQRGGFADESFATEAKPDIDAAFAGFEKSIDGVASSAEVQAKSTGEDAKATAVASGRADSDAFSSQATALMDPVSVATDVSSGSELQGAQTQRIDGAALEKLIKETEQAPAAEDLPSDSSGAHSKAQGKDEQKSQGRGRHSSGQAGAARTEAMTAAERARRLEELRRWYDNELAANREMIRKMRMEAEERKAEEAVRLREEQRQREVQLQRETRYKIVRPSAPGLPQDTSEGASSYYPRYSAGSSKGRLAKIIIDRAYARNNHAAPPDPIVVKPICPSKHRTNSAAGHSQENEALDSLSPQEVSAFKKEAKTRSQQNVRALPDLQEEEYQASGWLYRQ